MENYEKSYNMERCMVFEIAQNIERQQKNHATVARLAWPHLSDPVSSWREARNGKKGKKPKRLTCAEMLALCAVLSISFHDVYAEAKRLVREGWSYRKYDQVDFFGQPITDSRRSTSD